MSSPKTVSRLKAEEIMTQRFKGKVCCFDYPGEEPVYGMVDQIALDETGGEPMVIIQMNNKRYQVSPESLNDCLTALQ